MVEVETQENTSPMVEVFGGGMEDMGSNIKDMLGSLVPKKTKTKKMKDKLSFYDVKSKSMTTIKPRRKH